MHVFNGAERNEFVYYDDDGETLDYRKGQFRKRVITFDPPRSNSAFRAPTETLTRGLRGPADPARIQPGTSSDGQRRGNRRAIAGCSHAGSARDPSDVYWNEQHLESLRELEPMKPQTTLEFDDAPEVVVRWR